MKKLEICSKFYTSQYASRKHLLINASQANDQCQPVVV